MGDWALELAAKFEGLTDAQTAQVEAIVPDLQKLYAIWVEALPLIVKVTPVVQMAVDAVAAQEKAHPT